LSVYFYEHGGWFHTVDRQDTLNIVRRYSVEGSIVTKEGVMIDCFIRWFKTCNLKI